MFSSILFAVTMIRSVVGSCLGWLGNGEGDGVGCDGGDSWADWLVVGVSCAMAAQAHASVSALVRPTTNVTVSIDLWIYGSS